MTTDRGDGRGTDPSTDPSTNSSSSSSSSNRGTGLTSGHRVWRLGADIDTDALAPGHAMKYGIETIARHCLEAIRPDFAAGVRPGDVIVAGPNFGIGSSREQAASVLVHLGVAAVIAPAYSGLYFRNAFNLGLLLLTCADVEHLADGDSISLERGRPPDQPAVIAADGRILVCESVPGFLMDRVEAGGLLPQLKQRLARERAAASCHAATSTSVGASPSPTWPSATVSDLDK